MCNLSPEHGIASWAAVQVSGHKKKTPYFSIYKFIVFRHKFCFLCAKGVRQKKCALCRVDFALEDIVAQTAGSVSCLEERSECQWFYSSKHSTGWWLFDKKVWLFGSSLRASMMKVCFLVATRNRRGLSRCWEITSCSIDWCVRRNLLFSLFLMFSAFRWLLLYLWLWKDDPVQVGCF